MGPNGLVEFSTSDKIAVDREIFWKSPLDRENW
jgi:hypothetical protein